MAQIDLLGPGGLLDSKRYSANAPTVTIRTPSEGGVAQAVDGKVRVEWEGFDADGDALLYSVFYSSNGGERWANQIFEDAATAAEVRVDEQGAAHAVKVVVTDGARSAEAVVRFSLGGGKADAPPPDPEKPSGMAETMVRPQKSDE